MNFEHIIDILKQANDIRIQKTSRPMNHSITITVDGTELFHHTFKSKVELDEFLANAGIEVDELITELARRIPHE